MIWLRGNKVTVRAHACPCHSIFGQKDGKCGGKTLKEMRMNWKNNEQKPNKR